MCTDGRSNEWARSGRRVLCLGNELLAGDALGWVAAEQCEQLEGESVTYASATGYDILENLLDVSDFFVVDTFQTDAAEAGTVDVFHEEDMNAASGPSPH